MVYWERESILVSFCFLLCPFLVLSLFLFLFSFSFSFFFFFFMGDDTEWVSSSFLEEGTIDEGGVKIHLPTIGDEEMDANLSFGAPPPPPPVFLCFLFSFSFFFYRRMYIIV